MCTLQCWGMHSISIIQIKNRRLFSLECGPKNDYIVSNHSYTFQLCALNCISHYFQCIKFILSTGLPCILTRQSISIRAEISKNGPSNELEISIYSVFTQLLLDLSRSVYSYELLGVLSTSYAVRGTALAVSF